MVKGQTALAKALGVSQKTASKYVRDDRWTFGRGPWTRQQISKAKAWRREHYPTAEEEEGAGRGTVARAAAASASADTKLQLMIEKLAAQRRRNAIESGEWVDKEEVGREYLARILAVRAALMNVRVLAIKMEGKGLIEREEILEEWARGVCNKFAADAAQ